MERFWNKINKTNHCWNWTAAKKDKYYGGFRYKKKYERAHRVSWIMHNGPIPNSLHVLHSCDNTLCVNPSHLFLGTHQDNMKDRQNKRRTASGMKSGHSKLSLKSISEIKLKYIPHKYGCGSVRLAREYNVSPTTILYLVKGKTYK